MRERELRKVTSFIVRPKPREVLLLRHPFAGIQFAAGEVEAGETPEAAAARAALEQTGLDDIGGPVPAGVTVEEVVGAGWLVAETTPVFFRPDAHSDSWAILRRGVSVTSERELGGFVQITYEEVDRMPSPQYLTARITGWVPREALARVRRRFFFLLPCEAETPPAWSVDTGRDDWVLFWAPIDRLPALIPPQDQWIPYLTAATGGAPLLSAIMRRAAA
jgi:8-oxo-dGTP pyrophosphatase MutT (NUDIX family)